jgi:hypothetical protein
MGNFFILTENNIFLGVVYNLHEEISMVKKYNSKCDFLINCFWWSNQLYSTNKVFLLKKTWLVIFHSVPLWMWVKHQQITLYILCRYIQRQGR